MDICFNIGIFLATSNAPFGHEDGMLAVFFVLCFFCFVLVFFLHLMMSLCALICELRRCEYLPSQAATHRFSVLKTANYAGFET